MATGPTARGDLRETLPPGRVRRGPDSIPRQRFSAFLLEARGDPVVTRKIEIDDLVRACTRLLTARRPCLDESRREMPRLREQEQTDLRDMGSRRDMHEV